MSVSAVGRARAGKMTSQGFGRFHVKFVVRKPVLGLRNQEFVWGGWPRSAPLALPDRLWPHQEHSEGWSKGEAPDPSLSLEGKRLLHPTPPKMLPWGQPLSDPVDEACFESQHTSNMRIRVYFWLARRSASSEPQSAVRPRLMAVIRRRGRRRRDLRCMTNNNTYRSYD